MADPAVEFNPNAPGKLAANTQTLEIAGDRIGGVLGIVGSTLLMLLFLYSLRKRHKLGFTGGKLSRWLDVHIWMGITGPALITLHSAFKFHGIVTVSFFSMMAVMISGFIGRYIYIQISRDDAGATMSSDAVDSRIAMLTLEMKGRYGVTADILRELDEQFPVPSSQGSSTAGVLKEVLRYDLTRPIRKVRLRRYLASRSQEIPGELVSEIVRLSIQKATLTRRKAVLSGMNSLFHLWHVVHKPFAYVMVLVMIIHIVVVASMGYTWVF